MNPDQLAKDKALVKRLARQGGKPFQLTAPKKPRPFVPKEYDEQIAVFDYARIAAKQDPRWSLLFATMNGVRVSIGQAKKMKRAGNKSGVPDLFLPVRSDGKLLAYPGLWIELKRQKRGVLSDDQKWWHAALAMQGYQVRVAKGAQMAIAFIKAYLED